MDRRRALIDAFHLGQMACRSDAEREAFGSRMLLGLGLWPAGAPGGPPVSPDASYELPGVKKPASRAAIAKAVVEAIAELEAAGEPPTENRIAKWVGTILDGREFGRAALRGAIQDAGAGRKAGRPRKS